MSFALSFEGVEIYLVMFDNTDVMVKVEGAITHTVISFIIWAVWCVIAHLKNKHQNHFNDPHVPVRIHCVLIDPQRETKTYVLFFDQKYIAFYRVFLLWSMNKTNWINEVDKRNVFSFNFFFWFLSNINFIHKQNPILNKSFLNDNKVSYLQSD